MTMYIPQLLPSSDHYCVVCDLSVIKDANHAKLQQSRKLNGINLKAIKQIHASYFHPHYILLLKCLMTANGSCMRSTHLCTLVEYQ